MSARSALVTGASSGIGAEFARQLARRGWHVVLVARRADRLHDLAEQLGGSERALAIPTDLATGSGIDALEARLADSGVEIELLVNNAGLGHTGRFHEAPRERLLTMVDVDVRAVVDLTRRLLPGMISRGRGSVLNVVSMSAFQPVPYLAVYAAAKAFVLSWSESLAVELQGTGVRVQALCPGLVQTEFQRAAGTDKVRFDATPTTSASDVVEASLDALATGRTRVFPAWRDRLMVALQRVLPEALVRRVAAELFRPMS